MKLSIKDDNGKWIEIKGVSEINLPKDHVLFISGFVVVDDKTLAEADHPFARQNGEELLMFSITEWCNQGGE